MKSKLLLVLLSLVVYIPQIEAFYPKLSPKAEISLITSDPGDLIYEAFGHSALRISDDSLQIDMVYNFGTFDFFQENFVLNFLKGYLKYYLSASPIVRSLQSYQYRGVEAREQILDLSANEKQLIFETLEENRKEENKYYYYDYFYNNCATKWRDLLRNVLAERLKLNKPESTNTESIRSLMLEHLDNHPWNAFGINLVLGSKIDQTASFEEYLYLPKYLEIAFAHATVSDSSGNRRPLVKFETKLFSPIANEVPENKGFTPNEAAWLLLAFGILLTVFEWTRKSHFKWLSSLLFISAGIVGLIILMLWTLTNHFTSVNNFNILWAFPLHFVFGIMILFKQKNQINFYYSIIILAINSLLLLFWWLIPQHLPYEAIPLVILLSIRSYIYIQKHKKHNRFYTTTTLFSH